MNDIAFRKVKEDFGWLGNMSPHIVKYNDEWYRTAEALFQCNALRWVSASTS